MKLMFASDIHGSLYYCDRTLGAYRREGADKLILLGDLLYHGPRNPLPREYNPAEVAKRLNSVKHELLCVRGNCDADVDQMVLEFPILADSMILYLDGHMVFVSHGHVHNPDSLPPLKPGDILMQGHTHVPAAERRELAGDGKYVFLNPGSVALPKEGSAHSYMVYENGVFTIRNFDGEDVKRIVV